MYFMDNLAMKYIFLWSSGTQFDITHLMDLTAPIGIFDSGIGGLTVLNAIASVMPSESTIYLGDTARVPYGSKSAETVARYARECADFLYQRNVKAIVIACNTATAYALQELQFHFDIPVIGVIEPGAHAALNVSHNKYIGVIGTAGTIASNGYGRMLKSMDASATVISRACPLFVPLIEEGLLNHDITHLTIMHYLHDMMHASMDTLILGCTHYPLLRQALAAYLGDGIHLVDSAQTTAATLHTLLTDQQLLSSEQCPGKHHVYVTDLPMRFEHVAHQFLGHLPISISRIDF